MGSFNKNDVTYIVAWEIEGERSEEHEILKPYDEIDPEKKYQTISLKELGIEPIKVEADSKITTLIKVKSNNHEQMRCLYGYDGEKCFYSKLEGQDYDFNIEYSELAITYSYYNWGQHPFILYSK